MTWYASLNLHSAQVSLLSRLRNAMGEFRSLAAVSTDDRFGAERILAASVAQSTKADLVTRLSLGVSMLLCANPILEEMDRLSEASPTILSYP